MCSFITWISENWPDLLKDLVLTTVSVVIGYWLSVRWNRVQIEIGRKEEKRSLARSLALFVCDCAIAMRDARGNLLRDMPPHRSIPCYGIEYFQVELMRHEEKELVASVSTLRSSIEQANQLVPAIIQEFTAMSTDAAARAAHQPVLHAYCQETMRRYEDIQKHCEMLGAKIDAMLKESS